MRLVKDGGQAPGHPGVNTVWGQGCGGVCEGCQGWQMLEELKGDLDVSLCEHVLMPDGCKLLTCVTLHIFPTVLPTQTQQIRSASPVYLLVRTLLQQLSPSVELPLSLLHATAQALTLHIPHSVKPFLQSLSLPTGCGSGAPVCPHQPARQHVGGGRLSAGVRDA